MAMRLNMGVKDRVVNERGITTKTRNAADGRVYWIGTTRKEDGGRITAVARGKMFGIPGERIWEVAAASRDESMELHLAVEEVVQKQPLGKWAQSLPEARRAARKVIEGAEQAGLLKAPQPAPTIDESGFPGGIVRWKQGWLGQPLDGLTEEQNRCRAVLQQYFDCSVNAEKVPHDTARSLGSDAAMEQIGERHRACEEAAITALAQISPGALAYVYRMLRQPIKVIDQAQGTTDTHYLSEGFMGCRLINAALERIGKPRIEED